ncbi:angiopoietin-related protein 7-like [Stylophora pistillata]|uniref:angiopoietin-related protein 7-like n=1 Tax=Stylophora pistillata TaxID=50429 RepID=UPI000C03A5F7|nr:angiopoietin-related protein 7-like [Stylophora pistillata]
MENKTLARAKNCAELYKSGRRISGVYAIDPDGLGAFNVYCDQTTAGGGWAVFQRRLDGSFDFNRTWNDYKHGFGNLVGEFWLGLDKINRLTRNETYNKLRVDLGVTTDKTVHAEYDWFGIGTEMAKYRLYIGNITNATVFSDSLSPHRDFAFGTWDRNSADCAQKRGGGWWYGNNSYCAILSNLNGIYPRCGNKTRADIHWGKLVSNSAESSAPTSTEMKIRSVDFF